MALEIVTIREEDILDEEKPGNILKTEEEAEIEVLLKENKASFLKKDV